MAGTAVVPRADEVIGRFFAQHRRGSSGGRLRRLERAEADLRACLETLAPRLLTESELALVALERELRIRLAEPLAHEVLRLPELRGVRLGRAVGRVEATVRHAIWMVRLEREVARHG